MELFSLQSTLGIWGQGYAAGMGDHPCLPSLWGSPSPEALQEEGSSIGLPVTKGSSRGMALRLLAIPEGWHAQRPGGEPGVCS